MKDLRLDADQSQIIGGDANVHHAQIIGGIQPNYWEEYIPPSPPPRVSAPLLLIYNKIHLKLYAEEAATQSCNRNDQFYSIFNVAVSIRIKQPDAKSEEVKLSLVNYARPVIGHRQCPLVVK